MKVRASDGEPTPQPVLARGWVGTWTWGQGYDWREAGPSLRVPSNSAGTSYSRGASGQRALPARPASCQVGATAVTVTMASGLPAAAGPRPEDRAWTQRCEGWHHTQTGMHRLACDTSPPGARPQGGHAGQSPLPPVGRHSLPRGPEHCRGLRREASSGGQLCGPGPASHHSHLRAQGSVPQVLQPQLYTGACTSAPRQMSSAIRQRLPFFILTPRKNVSFTFCRARSLNNNNNEEFTN